MTEQVQDKPAEVGIKLNNILTFLILAVMTWVGVNITQMKEALGVIKVDDAVMKIEVKHIHEAMDAHREACNKRWVRTYQRLDKLERSIGLTNERK